jgi:uncharacterized membrane protein YfcA
VIEFYGLSISPAAAAVVVMATAIGGFMRGFVGFGGALALVPALSLALGPRVAVAVASIVGLPAVLQFLPEALRHADRSRIGPLALAILIGAPLGSLVLTTVRPEIMTGVIGAAVMLMALITWRTPSGSAVKPRPWLNVAAGGLSGILQGAAGIGGPPSVAVLMAQGGPTRQVRADVLAATACISVCGLASQLWFGIFTEGSLAVSALLVPIFLVSSWYGGRFFLRGGDAHFRAAALGILLVIGMAALIGSLRPLLFGP